MNWSDSCSRTDLPDMQRISNYVASTLWADICFHLEDRYGVSPVIEYSVCSGAPGWNVKYRNGGRALCTLYPAEGFFTCLVSVGSRETAQAELLLPTCTEAVRKIYQSAKVFNGGRWLMIPVTSDEVLQDAKQLIALRVQNRKAQ